MLFRLPAVGLGDVGVCLVDNIFSDSILEQKRNSNKTPHLTESLLVVYFVCSCSGLFNLGVNNNFQPCIKV